MGLGLIAERFELLAVAGAGAMGTVYRALDRQTAAQVAVKLLRGDAPEPDRFAREARVVAELTHPGIVRYVAHSPCARDARERRLAQARPEEGLEYAERGMAILDELGSLDEGEELVRLTYARALHAVGDHAAARATIAAARTKLLERAARISDERWRKSFLENVPENARTLSLAAAWVNDLSDSS